jgi:hypothetical protein
MARKCKTNKAELKLATVKMILEQKLSVAEVATARTRPWTVRRVIGRLPAPSTQRFLLCGQGRERLVRQALPNQGLQRLGRRQVLDRG